MNSIEEKIKNIIPTLNFKFPYSAEDYSNHLYFENYHCHKDFSNTLVADSGEPIENYAARTKYLGGKCLFSGEHGSQGNQFHVYNVAEKTGLNYRHSTEAYWVKDRKLNIQTVVDKNGNPIYGKDRTNCHIILVAKNEDGRKDINYALSMANIDGYYYRPRIDLELLLNIPKDNIIVTSACIAGWGYPDAADIWLKIHEHFGNNFFFEVQANLTDPQKHLNEKILRLSEKYGVDIIAGLDSHYIGEIGETKRNQILKYKNISYPEEEGWFLDYPDVYTLISRFGEQGILSEEQVLRAIMNTNIFVNDCKNIVFDRSFKIPSIYKDKTYEEKCKIYKHELTKAYKKEPLKSKEKIKGIQYEADEVISSGVVDYFLTSKRIVDDAVNNEGGILTKTSRGSAASFVTNKLIGLTTVDRFNSEVPIYPERFLTRERVQSGMMPDIDLNIAEQEPFIRATKKLLGENACYPLMAIEKLKTKAAWQLYAGANNVSPSDANQISKYIDEYEKALKHADDEEKESIYVEDYIPAEYIDLFRKSNGYQGITINLKVHACGYILFDGDIRKEIGLISATSKTTGKRTLCACIEGKVLDDFGLVKEDFLIVDSVSLTHECFQSIGKPVPTFTELKELVDGDQATWDIYAKGITCCVNQCEKAETIQKVMKYKPQNIGELSAFIAAIRPGFAPLLQTFLNRQSYSTGEKEIDKLLEDSSHFMIYQESIMKVLNYLGLEMGETYKVIKNISKKKYRDHPEELEKLKKVLITSWQDLIHNTDNFNNVWDVIESSALYSFNAPHAYSMAGDSLYQAWFKAHHTEKFYETAIKHYQAKNKKDKIDALVKEMIEFYGYKLGEYRFGDDNRTVHIDPSKKLIYPNISSIKSFGEQVAEDLFELGQGSYSNFMDVLRGLSRTTIKKPVIEKLVKIDYFHDYGEVNKLLKEIDLYNLLDGKKEISKDKAALNGISDELLQKYGHETAKKYNKLDTASLLNEIINEIPDEPLKPEEKMLNEFDIFGIVTTVIPDYSKNKYFVLEAEEMKTLTSITLYEIFSGKTRKVKIWNNQITSNPIKERQLIFIRGLNKKNKREPTGEINPKTGKKIYRDVPGKYEYWLKSYEVIKE